MFYTKLATFRTYVFEGKLKEPKIWNWMVWYLFKNNIFILSSNLASGATKLAGWEGWAIANSLFCLFFIEKVWLPTHLEEGSYAPVINAILNEYKVNPRDSGKKTSN